MVINTRVKTQDHEEAVGTFNCPSRSCITCSHINPDKYIVGPLDYVTPSSRFDCNSDGLVYVISCERCGSIYVGQTYRSIKKRFLEHRLDVLHKIKYPNSIPRSKVADHFSSDDHTEKDMRIAGIKFKLNEGQRLKEEDNLIRKLGAYLPQCMNSDYHFHN